MVGDRQGLGRQGGLSHISCPGRASARERRSGTQGDVPRYKMTMDAATETNTRAGWQHDLYDLLRRHDITQFAYVPDAGHSILIDRSIADPGVHSIPLTTEEEGVALIAGADLGGARAVLLMQSSGVGNCINMLSLIKGARFPFLTLVSMRGEFGEGNPWQFPMGQATQPVLEAMGVICVRIEQPQDVIPAAGAALTMAFKSGQAVAVLLSQRLIGAKPF